MHNSSNSSAAHAGALGGAASTRLLLASLLAVALVPCDGDNSSNGSGQGDGALSFGLAAADLNGDTLIDLVSATVDNQDSASAAAARVILRDVKAGDGFATAMDYGMGAQAQHLAVGDLNGDGRADLLVSNYADSALSLRLQSSAVPGRFLSRTVIDQVSRPREAAIADFNGDNLNDIAVIGSSIALLFNDATEPGNFALGRLLSLAQPGRTIASADLDRDGRMDLVVGGGGSVITVYLQDRLPAAAGTFSSSLELEVGDQPYDIALGDLNYDRLQDIVVVNWGRAGDVTAATVSVLFQRSYPSDRVEFNAARHYPIAGKGTSVVIADLDGDDLPDIAATNELAIGGGISVLYQRGGTLIGFDPEFEPAVLLPARLPYGLGAADFNGDRWTDLAITNPDGTIVLYQQPGVPRRFGWPQLVGAQPAAM